MAQSPVDHPPLVYPLRRWCALIGVSPSKAYSEAALGRLKIIRVAGRSGVEATESNRYLAQARAASETMELGRARGARAATAARIKKAQARTDNADNPAASLAHRRRRGRHEASLKRPS